MLLEIASGGNSSVCDGTHNQTRVSDDSTFYGPIQNGLLDPVEHMDAWALVSIETGVEEVGELGNPDESSSINLNLP
jgi:hypothetical protein